MPLYRRERRIEGAPTLVLLHGLASDADDLFSLASSLSLPMSVVALQAPNAYGSGWSWFDIDWTPEGLQLDLEGAATAVQLVLDEIALEASPPVLGGFSQGAMISAGVLCQRPEALKGALLMSGALLPNFKPVTGSPRPVLVTHGSEDPVVPFAAGEELANSLRSAHNVTFAPDRAAHTITPSQLFAISEWLKSLKEHEVGTDPSRAA